MVDTMADVLIEHYNMLDVYMREKLKVGSRMGHTDMLRQMARRSHFFGKHEPELIAFARLRNLMVHNVYPHEAEPFAQPNDYAVKKYQQLVNRIVKPPTALSVAVQRSDIFTTTLDARVMEVMKIMNEKYYTHVPVIEEENMVGVFSENTIFTNIAQKGIFIDEGTKIKEFADHLPLNKHKSEHFKFVDITPH